MIRFSRMALVFLTVLFVARSLAIGQSILSSITGTVTDPSGAVVQGATVVGTEIRTGVAHTQITNKDGIYNFSNILPGTYVVTVSGPGFKDLTSTNIILTANQSGQFNAKLQLGSSSQTVTVISLPTTINTQDAEVGSLITGQDAKRLPLSRSELALLALNPANVANGSGILIGGNRSVFSNLTIDGVTTKSNIYGGQSGGMTADQSYESLAEVKIITSNGSAEFPGFGTMTTTTKGGTNQLHGSGFYTTDNSALDSTPFQVPSDQKLKGPQLQWYGLSVGGPVWLGKLYDGRNKTFFFGTWEHRTFPLAAGNYSVGQLSLPTAAFRNGDFSSLLQPQYSPTGAPLQLTNPFTGAPFSGNIIPTNLISPVSNALQTNYFPAPNQGDPNSYADNYLFVTSSREHINRYDVRIDHHPGANDLLTGRFTRQYDPWLDRYGQPYISNNEIRTYNNTYLSETHTFTPHFVNELRGSWSYSESAYSSSLIGDAVLQQIGLQGIPPQPGISGFPEVDMAQGVEGFYANPQTVALAEFITVLDNVSWQKGKHFLKGGVLINYNKPHQTNSNGAQQFGQFGFNGFATGFSYADFLLGIPNSAASNLNPPSRYNRSTDTSFFLQDSWQATPRLSVTMGLRWEYFMPPTELHNERANFDPATAAVVLPSSGSLKYLSATLPTVLPVEISPNGFPGRSMLYGNKGNFGPRIGFAYQLGDRSVIRGGWGIYYAELINSVQDQLSGGGLFGTQILLYNSITNGVPAFQFPNPFAAANAEGSACTSQCLSVAGTDPHLKTPASQQYSLTYQRDLGRSTVVSVGYRGFSTINLPYANDLTIPPTSTDPANYTTSIIPLYSQVSWVKSGAIQNMNALDASLSRQFTSGLTFQVGYTLTKDLSDDADQNSSGGDGEIGSPSDPYNRRADYGNVYYVPRQRFVGTVVWDIPYGPGMRFGSNASKPMSEILGGWEVSNITILQSGNFLTPTYDGILADGSQQNIRPNLGVSLRPNCIGDWHVAHPSANEWFNPAAFAPPALGQYGTCGTGIIQGPGLWNVNLAANKSFKLPRGTTLRFDVNMMNAFNHPNLANPNTDLDSGYMGQIFGTNSGGLNAGNPTVVSADGERHIWVGARVDF
jgi:hypothetical protein